MHRNYLKSPEPNEPHPQPDLVPGVLYPPTAKKRLGLGRSVKPLRVGEIPELSQVLSDAARSERRSYGCSASKNESCEWAPTNNTIPETLNSSREWQMSELDRGRAASQNDVRNVLSFKNSEATPLKTFRETPFVMDKENLYTPRKGQDPSSAGSATPAQTRCPLSAIPVDVRDGGCGSASALPSDQVAPNFQQTVLGSISEKTGSVKKMFASNYDRDGFRTPQCKLNSGYDSKVQRSEAKQRMYGVSTSKMLDCNIPLHPAVIAGQQAKQLQEQYNARVQNAQALAPPQEPHDWKELAMEVTPFKSAHSVLISGQATSRPAHTSQSSVHGDNVSSLNSLQHPVSASVLMTPKPPALQPLSAGKDSQCPSTSTAETTTSTWLPHSKFGGTGLTPVRAQFTTPPEGKTDTPKAAVRLTSNDHQFKNQATPSTVNQFRVGAGTDINSVPHRPTFGASSHKVTCGQSLSPPIPERDESPKSVDQVSTTDHVSKNQAAPSPPGDAKDPPRTRDVHVLEAIASQNEPKKPLEAGPKPQPMAQGHSQIFVNGHPYTVLSLLGRGGSSKVFQVLDQASPSPQMKAVKCVNLADTEQVICDGYLNEIRLLAELQDSDCVIQMFDHEHLKEKQLLYVVMEKGDTDLSKLIKDMTVCKKISASMIVYYWTEMLNAVNFIHKRGTIHSDLKPANFLLVSGRLKLIDFGIASSVQEDMTSVVKDCLTGTYNYISPEALCSSSSSDGHVYKISYKSDVWSLGCILYNLVYGRTPFQHISGQFQKLNAIVNPAHKIQFANPSVEGCPSALIQAMKMCLVRNPKERASVDELLRLPYLGHFGPERGVLSQIASIAASVGLVQGSEDNCYASAIRAIQRLIMDNEKQLTFLHERK